MPSAIRVAKTAEALGFSESAVLECLQLREYVMGCTSLDMPVGEEGDSVLGDFIPADRKDNPEVMLDRICMKQDIDDILRTLTPREEKVLRMRFGIGEKSDHTLEEVGQDFFVTRERIRQIEAKALRKLRHPSRAKLLKAYIDNNSDAFWVLSIPFMLFILVTL